jgi:glycogen debranching enzyme
VSAAGASVNLADAVVLKESNVFLVAARDGSIPLGGTHPMGLYLDDCRFLSGHELRIAGEQPRLLVASAATGAEGVHELTNPELRTADGRLLAPQTLQLRLDRSLAEERRLRERIHVHQYGRARLELDVVVELDADFVAMLALRGMAPGAVAPEIEVEPVRGGLRFVARGGDAVWRATTVTAVPEPEPVGDRGLRFTLRLTPGGHEDLLLTYELHQGDGRPPEPRAPDAMRSSRAPIDEWLVRRTRVTSDDELFNRVLRRSLVDLRMLSSRLDGHDYYAAGIPWFGTLFGRDSLVTALETLAFDGAMAAGTLRLLADRLGRRVDAAHEEEPGKVLHELRTGEVAARALTPLARYYGTVDATPLFLCLVAEHAHWSGTLELFRELRGPVDAALGWIDRYGDHDGDGLLDYRQSAPGGLRNQGWKDSDDGVVDERGRPLEPPIALVEPQGYAVRAKRGLARLFAADGHDARAAALEREATELEARLERFWVPDRGLYAMGLDGDGRASAALASNQGHLLWAHAIPSGRAPAVRDALMSDAMFSGWGIRTLGRGEPGYNPVGYHLGTVWPHDTALIAVGLRRYGFDEDFVALFEALLEAASHADGYRLPELFAGFARTEWETPVPYPVACQPQAWAAGAIPYLLTSGLGLAPDGLNRRLRVRRPSLPRWVDRVEVEGVGVAGASVDLLFERAGAGEHVALTDVRITGDLEVVLEVRSTRDEP